MKNVNIKDNVLYFKELNNNEILSFFTLKPFNFNKELIRENEIIKEFNDLEKITNTKFRKIIRANQTHSNNITCITEENLNDNFDNIDGFITNLKNVALTTTLADCQGIFLYDEINHVIGNIHSGWKGTLNKIIVKALNVMIKNYNSKPSDIKVFINPSILTCCFEVDSDVYEKFLHEFKDININNCIKKGSIKNNKQKYYIDTILINKYLMQNLGIKSNNIFTSNVCTKCNSNMMHSYRQEHLKSGRNIALICLKEN